MFGQENINDRLGWHHVMMGVAPWPLILLSLSDLWRRKPMLTRDLEDALYTKTAYSITEILASLPASAGVFLAFTVPAYLLTGKFLYSLVIGSFILNLDKKRLMSIFAVNDYIWLVGNMPK